ncbi:MAG: DegT/DnrJ/EryC1/StrS family aminotransferase [Rhodospirillales bacterium]|nr:DegT/DnrJ/EryC1/StrS family aminotransferase [Rhodospirillales bacterium]
MADFIPVNEPLLQGNELAYVTECLTSGWISSEGRFVHGFEEGFSARVGRRFGIGVSNGSDALELAVAALGLGPGDDVILPAFTIISCASAVVRAGATPVLVDSDPVAWTMDPEAVRKKITSRTRAIMAVHIYGLPVDMDPVMQLAREHGLKLIEDAAEAIGLAYKGRPCGSFGDISTFSFYANKHVTTGEGGLVAVDDPALEKRCRSLRNLCFGEERFIHHGLGWNMRMTNIQAAIGLAQLESLERAIERKKRMGRRYTDLMKDIAGIKHPAAATAGAENVYWVYGLVLDDDVPFDAREAMRRLKAMGIDTRPFFWPMHEQPVFQTMGLFKGERYPVVERLARRGFYVPSGLALTDDQMQRVADGVRRLMSR